MASKAKKGRATKSASAELTPRQLRFVAEYLVDLNGTRAAIRAGYSAATAESQASRLLRNAKVSAAIATGKATQADRLEVKADTVLRELLRIATSDISQAFDANGGLRPLHEIPEDVRRAISSVETEELRLDGKAVGVVRKVKFWSKPSGLEMLGKHLKLFTDKTEITGKDGGPVETNARVEVKDDRPDADRTAAILGVLRRVGAIPAGGGAEAAGGADGAAADEVHPA